MLNNCILAVDLLSYSIPKVQS